MAKIYRNRLSKTTSSNATKDNTGCVSSEIEVFNIDHIPQMIQFPVGHPIPGTIYIGNPFVPNMYIPYEGYEFEFFLSKVNEYCRLLQCLGATEITIKTIKGRSASDSKEQINNTNGSLGVKAFSGSSEKMIRETIKTIELLVQG